MAHYGDYTEIEGSFELNKPLDDDTIEILEQMRKDNYVRRDPEILGKRWELPQKDVLSYMD